MRRERTDDRAADAATTLTEWRRELWSRRRFLLRMAGGSVLALFARANLAAEPEPLGEARRWELLDAVQQHLFPSEPDSPGAREINALAYLRFVVSDPKVDAEDRQFILARLQEQLDTRDEHLTNTMLTDPRCFVPFRLGDETTWYRLWAEWYTSGGKQGEKPARARLFRAYSHISTPRSEGALDPRFSLPTRRFFLLPVPQPTPRMRRLCRLILRIAHPCARTPARQCRRPPPTA